MANSDEAYLIDLESALHGDINALGQLFHYYRPRLLADALKVCGNLQLSQDVVQDTFISAVSGISSLKDKMVFYPWLRKILFNRCFQLLRKEKSLFNIHNSIAKDTLIQNSIEHQLDQSSNQQILYHFIESLSDELRSCVLLRYFSSFYSYDDISTILGIPTGTVRSRLSAAREKLKIICTSQDNAGTKAFTLAKFWTDYYHQLWSDVYDDLKTRNELFNHIHPDVQVRNTNGICGNGRTIVEKEVDDDLKYGSRFKVLEINTCGNISVIEGVNLNSLEFPDRCPYSSVFVLYRQSNFISTFQLHHSNRK